MNQQRPLMTIQKKILDLLVNIRDEFGISILFISHDLGVIRSITSRVNVMYKGSILEEGLTEEVLKHPKHLYTHGLIACKPPLYQKLERLPVVSDFVNISDRDGSLAFTQNEDKKSLERKHLVTPDRDAEPILRVENLTVKYPLKKISGGNN